MFNGGESGMPATNLILIDGIPGSGKSTTAQWLWLQLLAEGRSAQWHYENAATHPIFRPAEAGKPDGHDRPPGAELMAQSMSNWRRLSDSLRGTGNIVILESTLFQTTLGRLLALGTSPEEIRAHAFRVQECLALCRPVLVYFRPMDVTVALGAIRARRGEWFRELLIGELEASAYGKARAAGRPVDWTLVEGYYRDFLSITDDLYARFDLPKWTADTSQGEWEDHRRGILRFLGLSGAPLPRVSEAALAPLAGLYRVEASGEDLQIVADGERLYVGEDMETPLVPGLQGEFFIAGMCVRLLFRKGTGGAVEAVESQGDLSDADKTWLKVRRPISPA